MHKHIVLLNDKKQLLNSISQNIVICRCLWHRQIIDPLATDKSRYFAQPRPIIVYYYIDKSV